MKGTAVAMEEDVSDEWSSAPPAPRAVAVSPQQFEAAIAPLLPRLYRFCLALCRNATEAEDLLQDGLVKAFVNADSFDSRGEFFAWLCSILRREFLEARRTQARRKTLLDSVLDGCTNMLGSVFTGGSTVDPEEFAEQNQQSGRLLHALHKVPEQFRLVVLLCDVEELGYQEVSTILGVPVGTVKSRHARGRTKLNEAYLQLYGNGDSTEGGKR
jgi:RNA polymerase sigma-70 factor (ECF subfamily)